MRLYYALSIAFHGSYFRPIEVQYGNDFIESVRQQIRIQADPFNGARIVQREVNGNSIPLSIQNGIEV